MIITKLLGYLRRDGISDIALLCGLGILIKVAVTMLGETGDLELLKIALLRDLLEAVAAFVLLRLLSALQDNSIDFNYKDFFDNCDQKNKVILISARNFSFALLIGLVML